MIVVLHPETNQAIAEQIASHIRDAFKGRVEVILTKANSPSAWPVDVNWDDLLLVVFDGARFPDAGNDFIGGYVQQRKKRALLLPVALDVGHRKPPKAAEAIKALEFDAAAAGVDGRLVKRIAASDLVSRAMPVDSKQHRTAGAAGPVSKKSLTRKNFCCGISETSEMNLLYCS